MEKQREQREAREFDRRFLAVALRTVANENGIATIDALRELSGKWPNEFRPGTIGTGSTAGRSVYDFIRKNKLRNIDFRAFGPDGQTQRGRYNLNAARAILTQEDWQFAQDHFNVPAAEIDLESIHEAEAKAAIAAGVFGSRVREMQERWIAVRPEQVRFRQELGKIYDCCPISGCNSGVVLEAAHILPENGPLTNKVWNGMLVRADIHILLDEYLISIDSSTGKVLLSPELEHTTYVNELSDAKIDFDKLKPNAPAKTVLDEHRARALQKCSISA